MTHSDRDESGTIAARGAEADADASGIIMRGTGSLALGFLVRLGARLLFVLIAGRLFGAALFGAFILAVAIVELAVTIGNVGTKKMLFQFLDERGERPPGHVVLDAALLVTLVSLALAAAIAAAALLLPRQALSANTASAMALLAPAVAGQALLDLFSAATRWRHLIRYEMIGRSIVEPYAGVAGTVAAWLLGFTAEGLLIGYWAGTLTALLYVALGARRAIGGFGIASWRTGRSRLAAMLRGTWANTASDFLSGFYARMDLYLVGLLLGEGAAGIYGMARQVRTPIRQVRQSFDGLLTPIVARTLSAAGTVGTGAALASAARLILVIQLPLLILLGALGAPFLAWIGPTFAAGYWALLCLAAAEAIQGAFGLGEFIFVYRRPRLGLWVTATSIAVGVVAGLVLIPIWGVTGAGISVLLSFALRALHRRRLLAKQFGVRPPATHSAGPVAAALAGAAISLLVVEAAAPSLMLYIAAGICGLAVYGGLVLLWMKLSGERIRIAGFVADSGPDNAI